MEGKERSFMKANSNGNEGREKCVFSRYAEDYLFIAPFVILFCMFTVLPVAASVALSFTNYNVLEIPSFVGLQNYYNLFFNDSLFLTALKNTFFLSVVTGPAGYILSLVLAWALNEFGNKLRTFLTLLFYAPSISGGAYMIWQIIYSGDSYGFLNGILMKTGIIYSPIQWLTDTKYMMGDAVIAILWMSFGTGFLSLIAGFKNVDARLYEAAAVDGVQNRFQELWFVTLPSMKPQLLFSAVMSITGSFGIGDVLTAIYGFPSSGYAVFTLAHEMQDYGSTRFEMGYASTIAVVLFAIMVGANAIVQHLLKRVGE